MKRYLARCRCRNWPLLQVSFTTLNVQDNLLIFCMWIALSSESKKISQYSSSDGYNKCPEHPSLSSGYMNHNNINYRTWFDNIKNERHQSVFASPLPYVVPKGHIKGFLRFKCAGCQRTSKFNLTYAEVMVHD